MRTIGTLFLSALLGLNAVWMLLGPASWYEAVPGVAETGPFNVHFVRDIGMAYLVVAGALLWQLRDPRAWPAAVAGGAFLALHALLHATEYLHGPGHGTNLFLDLLLIFLPAAAVLQVGFSGRRFAFRTATGA